MNNKSNSEDKKSGHSKIPVKKVRIRKKKEANPIEAANTLVGVKTATVRKGRINTGANPPIRTSGRMTVSLGTDRLKKKNESLTRKEIDQKRLLQEMRVKMEAQNPELRRLHGELEESRERYFELYDLAPTPYLTISSRGQILEANLAAADMLDSTREGLVRRWFSRFLTKESADVWYRFKNDLARTGEPQTCQVQIAKADNTLQWVDLKANIAERTDGTIMYRVTMIDATARRLTEQLRRGEKRLSFEMLISDISGQLKDVSPDRKDAEIENALRRIMEFFEFDRCGIVDIHAQKPFSTLIHAVYSQGIDQIPKGINLSALFPWCHDKLLSGAIVNFETVDDLPAEAEIDKKTFRATGTKSALHIPLTVNDRLSKIFAINSVRKVRTWPEEYTPRLRLLGEIIAAADERLLQKAELEQQLGFVTLLSDISRRFINLPFDQVDKDIEDSQRSVCEFFGLDFCMLWQNFENKHRSMKLTHAYKSPESLPDFKPTYAAVYFPWSMQQMNVDGIVAISSPDDYPPEAARDKELSLINGIKSILFLSLVSEGDKPLGILLFGTKHVECAWTETMVKQLQLIAQVFTGTLIHERDETTLRESEARLSLTTEAVNAGLWIMDVETKEVWVSPKSRELFCFDPDEEITYESYFRLIHPEDHEQVHQAVRHALETGEELQCDYRIVAPDGSIRWIVVRGQRYLEMTGKSNRLMGLALDITERKLAELQVVQNLDAMVQLQHLATLYVRNDNLQAVLTDIVDSAIAIAGADFGNIQLLDETTGDLRIVAQRGFPQWWLDFWDSVSHGKGASGTALEGCQRVIIEDVEHSPIFVDSPALNIQRKAGVRAVQSTPLMSRSGKIIGMLSTHYKESHRPHEPVLTVLDLLARQTADIVERFQAEEALRKSEERFDLALRGSQEGLWDWNMQTNEVYYSTRWKEMLGYAPDEIEPHVSAWQRLLHPDDRARAEQLVHEVRRNERDYTIEFRMQHKDGHYIDILSRGFPVRGEPGGPILRIVGTHFDLTERKEIELRLKESQTLLLSLINSTSDLIWSVDAEHFGLLAFNRGLTEYFLNTHGIHIKRGMRPEDMLPEKYAQIWHSLYRRAIEEGTVTTEYKTSGGDLTLSLNINSLTHEGRAFGVSVFARNITQRKRMELQLKESQTLLLSLFNSTTDFIWSVDIEHFSFLAFNRALAEYFLKYRGIRIEIGMGSEDLMPAEGARYWHALYRKAIRKGNITTQFRAPGSGLILLVNVNRLQRDEHTFGVSVFARDITEFKNMEANLTAAAKEWQSTFDASQDCLLIVDLNRKIIRSNLSAISFLGCSAEEIIGQNCNVVMHGTEIPPQDCPFTKAIELKRQVETEYYDKKRQAWLQVSVSPILDNEGNIYRVVHSMKDITRQKEMEVESYTARSALHHTDRLLQMGELTASLAHELNQPLTSILSNTRAALRFIKSGKLNPEELTEILHDIVNDDKRAGHIIRSLRAMVRPQENEREIVDTNEIVREVVTLFHSEVIIRGIAVETDLEAAPLLINVDKIQLQQVVINLMMNAADSVVRASDRKKIIIQTRKGDEGGVLVSVRDFGAGIAEDRLTKIFEPFFTTKHSGLGMGLSLSRSIIENHDGHIWAENNADGGATFFFNLPDVSTKNSVV